MKLVDNLTLLRKELTSEELLNRLIKILSKMVGEPVTYVWTGGDKTNNNIYFIKTESGISLLKVFTYKDSPGALKLLVPDLGVDPGRFGVIAEYHDDSWLLSNNRNYSMLIPYYVMKVTSSNFNKVIRFLSSLNLSYVVYALSHMTRVKESLKKQLITLAKQEGLRVDESSKGFVDFYLGSTLVMRLELKPVSIQDQADILWFTFERGLTKRELKSMFGATTCMFSTDRAFQGAWCGVYLDVIRPPGLKKIVKYVVRIAK